MLAPPLLLALQLPPLAFGPALPSAFAPPRELVCTVADLGRLRVPATVPGPPIRTPLASDRFRPDPPERLVGPVTDGFLFLGLTLLSHATGGSVTPDAWPGDRHWFSQRK